ncbi:hypothetical protein OROGR_001369 [Orobanche gracilis]
MLKRGRCFMGCLSALRLRHQGSLIFCSHMILLFLAKLRLKQL